MPAVFLNILRMCLLALWVLLGGHAAAHAESASEPVSSGTVEKLQDRVIELEKETAVLKAELSTRIDAQDNRISDGIGLHGAQVTMLSNQTAQLGNLIQWMAIGIAVVGLIGGFFAFRRAEQIAKEQSEKWFKDNEADMRKEISETKVKAQEACHVIDGHKNQVVDKAVAAQHEMTRFVSTIINRDITSGTVGALSQKDTNQQSYEKSNVSEDTKFFMEGLEKYSNGDCMGALDAFSRALDELERSKPPDWRIRLAKVLLKKSLVLGELGRLDEAVATCEDIERRFDNYSEPELCKQVFLALSLKGIHLVKGGHLDAGIAAIEYFVKRVENSEDDDIQELASNARRISSELNKKLKLK